MAIERGTVVKASGNQVSCELAGELIFLNVASGQYFSLDGVGVKIWQSIQQPKTVGEIVASLLQSYDVDEGTCMLDVCELLEEMSRLGLVETAKSTPA